MFLGTDLKSSKLKLNLSADLFWIVELNLRFVNIFI